MMRNQVCFFVFLCESHVLESPHTLESQVFPPLPQSYESDEYHECFFHLISVANLLSRIQRAA